MPANLTPDYLAAEREYREARAPAERIAALERMLATLPKHKGTEKLQADLRRRLSQARKESQKKGPAHSSPFYLVEREGAGQVVLIGPPNSGKSQLVCALTHARPEVADYPFTTRLPTPGMMNYEDVQIQLVDLPPISSQFMEPWIPQVIRNAHTGVLVVDLAESELLEQVEFIAGMLERNRLGRPPLLVGNKLDLPGAELGLAVLQDLYGDRYRCLGLSAATGRNLEVLVGAVFDVLGLVRVYTKAPGKKFDRTAPYVLRRGQTVEDAARLVHQDFAHRLKYARLFHLSGGPDGLLVERHHLVEDRDVLEFHI